MEKKGQKIVMVLFAVAVLLIAFARWTPAVVFAQEEENPFRNENKVEVAAHRSGKNVAPENTMAAFERAAKANREGEFRVDIFEFDLRMTKDEKLILLHDDTLDRTTNIKDVYKNRHNKNYYPIDYTYEELRALNAAVDYTDKDGNKPFKNMKGNEAFFDDNLRIPCFDEVAAFLQKEKEATGYPYRFIIEIKDGGELGKRATDQLYDILVERGFLDATVVGTFHQEISDYYDTKPGLMRSAGMNEVAKFLGYYITGKDLSHVDLPYVALQIPMRLWWVQLPFLHSQKFVDYAHKYGLALQYWTINDEKDMSKMAYEGVDAIITDSPDVLTEVLNGELKYSNDDTFYVFCLLVIVVLAAIIAGSVFAIKRIIKFCKRNVRKCP